MKYIVILGDGMSDLPVPELGGRTPLMVAKKPNMDALAKVSEAGLVKTVPDSLKPGSDIANLSVMGYDPELYYTGRSPLEAISMGIELKDTDTTFRCNLVTLSANQPFEEKIMIDYSSDEISSQEARRLIEYAGPRLMGGPLRLYPGVSYRHCLVWSGFEGKPDLTPPHDISEKKVGKYLPKGEGSEVLLDLMKKSYPLLSEHFVNRERVKRGLRSGNCLWFWGQGKKPSLKPFKQMYGVEGAAISAVDLIKGIAKAAGMRSIDVEGATGTLTTNFGGKVRAALDALEEGCDYVYIHIEAPDECGHRREVDGKVRAIELIDEKVLGPILEGMEGKDYNLLIMPDHPTPLSTRTHSRDPVPYLLYRSGRPYPSKASSYDEESAKDSGNFVGRGTDMIKKLLGL
ncbi:MAG: cofactor-independent phosphoglycerate mutase [Clostridiales bacterium]|jgi:2,3-bisphosphoglycerate-independent phosphoglycerate mutase|nr:cofactor-independent phosphoglycerate mutase [Clostridiales bacterium]